MPLCSNSKNCNHDRQSRTQLHAGVPLPAPVPALGKRSSRCITVGLVNNMPDTALEATERQFRSLLASASDGMTVRLSLFALPDVPRADAGKRHIANSYASIEDLLDSRLDGLIITGAEPRTASLTDEPYWDSFTRVLAWASENTHSTVFSCLAAHAAILQMDGIGRRRSDDKHFGVFDCARLSDHRILAGTPSRFKLPHSRWNGISEHELTASGYSVLASSDDVGVDIFVKRCKALFVFFQSHPEYDSDSLLREYRRDVGRYLRAESSTYPSLPKSYFDNGTEDELEALREQALSSRAETLQANVSDVLEKLTIDNSWNSTAVSIYRNWLQYIQEQKTETQSSELTIIASPHEAAAIAASREFAPASGLV
jgi:homoserine O-succinyltransferase